MFYTLLRFEVGGGKRARSKNRESEAGQPLSSLLGILQPKTPVQPLPGASGLPSNSHAWTLQGQAAGCWPQEADPARQSQGTRGLTGSGRAGGGADGSGGGGRLCACAAGRGAGPACGEKASGGRQLARFIQKCFATASGIIGVSEPAGGRPDPWPEVGRWFPGLGLGMGGQGRGVEDADRPDTVGPVAPDGRLSFERISGPDVSGWRSPALLFSLTPFPGV